MSRPTSRISDAPGTTASVSRDHQPAPRRILDLWGKLPRGATRFARDPARYHPLAYHLIDAAVSAEALWARVLPAATRDLYCSLLQAEPEAACRWLMFLAGLHDLGKATPGFQGQDAGQATRLTRRGWVLPRGAARAHDALGLMILHGLLRGHADDALQAAPALDLATVVAAHHGVPAAPRPALGGERHLGNAAWGSARIELFELLAHLSRVHAPAAHLPAPLPGGLMHPSRALLSLLGGVVRVADWLASRQSVPDAVCIDEEEYAAQAALRAWEAVEEADWGQAPPPAAGFAELFGFPPNAVQQRVAALAGPVRAPAMVLIEAPTGSGKTEAALHLAHQWLGHGHQAGLYVALPTQATASAMHERLRGYPAEAHVHRFAASRLCHAGMAADDASALSGSDAARLLDGVGVGTVDQALLAVLSDRQAWVRLLGLANKIVILDEVHAYDAYTSGLLRRLLQWLAALNCSVIMLSATLPAAQRAELIRAYGAVDGPVQVAYPRVTLATETYQEVAPLPAGDQRHVHLRHVSGRRAWGRELLVRLTDGGCAAVICNTVAAAQATYADLRRSLAGSDVALSLLHARYPQVVRETRERHVLRQFGRAGRRPRRAIVVGTQVLEQSLDLDFDLLVSQWAPADVLVQRLGRLHRHERERPAGLAAPEAWLLQPRRDGDGLPDFGASAAVYDEYILLRTWQLLHDRSTLTLPADTETLIEGCYRPPDPADVAAPLATRLQAAARRLEARMQAQDYEALRHAEGSPEAPGLAVGHRDAGRTRWEELPALQVVCLQHSEGVCRLAGTPVRVDDPPTAAAAAAMARHAITLRGHEPVDALQRQPRPEGWRRHPLLHALTPLPLDERLRAQLDGATVALDEELGLTVQTLSAARGGAADAR